MRERAFDCARSTKNFLDLRYRLRTWSIFQHRFERLFAFPIHHPSFPPVYQVGEVDGRTWFSMLFVDGPTLYECSLGKTFGPEKIAKTIECIARAIDAVHRRGILHGDIKPQNILIEREANRPMISDFGLAEFESVNPERNSFSIAGTPAYIAPELAKAALSKAASFDAASIPSVSSDVYSLGATLWSALAGTRRKWISGVFSLANERA